MKTIRQYANENGVSYEAIRKQIKLYKEELEPHLVKEGRATLLTDKAIEILNKKRSGNNIIIVNQSKDEELERLRNEVDQLNKKVQLLQEHIIAVEREKFDIALELKEKTVLLEVKSQPPKQPFFKRLFGN